MIAVSLVFVLSRAEAENLLHIHSHTDLKSPLSQLINKFWFV